MTEQQEQKSNNNSNQTLEFIRAVLLHVASFGDIAMKKLPPKISHFSRGDLRELTDQMKECNLLTGTFASNGFNGVHV